MIAFDHSIAQQESVLNVDVGVVVQEDFHAAGPLPDDGQLKRRRTFITEWVDLSLELQKEPDERVPPIVGSHVERSPAIIALCINDVTPVLRL